MTLADAVRARTDARLLRLYRRVRTLFSTKSGEEMHFWRTRFAADGGRFNNAHYERLMLAMAEEPSGEFLRDKVVADFGCGPRGSLVWARSAGVRIGIDVLADRYADEFADELRTHGMVYLKCTEHIIPLPSDFVDVMFTLNAIDHVDSFEEMCAEILRVLKPGGEFIGSFNLHEPASPTEPQSLDEALIHEHLLGRMLVGSCRAAEKGPADDLYGPVMTGGGPCPPGVEGFLWVRARKAPLGAAARTSSA